MAADLDKYEVWLLLDRDVLYPFSSHGFAFAQGRLSSVAKRSLNNVFLRADGRTFKIKSIHPIRNNLLARGQRFLGLPYEIQVELTPHHLSVSDLRSRIAIALENYVSMGEPDESWRFMMQPLPDAQSAVLGASDAKEVYSILELPAPKDCLDLL